jgi:hypothetical protein
MVQGVFWKRGCDQIDEIQVHAAQEAQSQIRSGLVIGEGRLVNVHSRDQAALRHLQLLSGGT